MKTTGIVRKLDDLGRIVIPKEIRRGLKIKEGSPIEIVLSDKGDVILSKYSMVESVKDYAEVFCMAIAEVHECGVFITDRDKIIAVSGVSKKDYLGMELSDEMLSIIESKKDYIANVLDRTTIYPIYREDKTAYYSELVVPIVVQGECEGLLGLVNISNKSVFDKCQISTSSVVVKFISKQIDL
jgi:AbrB family transcriptional regulator (stage V sporulation protein T)